MSNDALAWAWRKDDLNASQKLTLIAIADIVNYQNGYRYWAGNQYLADKCGTGGIRQIVRNLQKLEELGYISIQKEGARRKNVITLNMGEVPDTAHRNLSADSTLEVPDSTVRSAVSGTREVPDTAPLNKNPIEPNIEPNNIATPSRNDEKLEWIAERFGRPADNNSSKWALYQKLATLAESVEDIQISEVIYRKMFDVSATVPALIKHWELIHSPAGQMNTMHPDKIKQLARGNQTGYDPEEHDRIIAGDDLLAQ